MSDLADAAAPTTLRTSPLDARHRALGAKMADFGGWSMPIEYPGGGVVREHTAVRERVGVFDVSHLGKVLVRGAGAADYLNTALSNDLGRITSGQAQYTLCCNDSGGVVDDLIAYLRSPHEVLLVPNAANTAEVVRLLQAEAPTSVEVVDQHEAYGVLAVQGPQSEAVVDALGLPTGHDYLSYVDATWRGLPVIVCRTGYTGERGFELLPAWDAATELWDALIVEAAARGGLPAGLGARDTLRTEMGYPLHGHELAADISPLEARSGWAVGWSKPAFWGREALTAQRAAGADRLMRGLLALDRGIPRAGCTVSGADGGPVGVTTSGTFSPTLKQGIALALINRTVAEGDEVQVDVRGRPLRCRVVKPPFVAAQTRATSLG